MFIGYAGTSTVDQKSGYESQILELQAQGCEKIFEEQVSSVAQRDELKNAIEFAREGDTLVVCKLDRLARSITHLWKIIEELEAKCAGLKVLDLGIDTKSATGKLVLTLLGGINEFERSLMLERQRFGIAKAKAAGKYKGRKPTARAKTSEILNLKKSGVPALEIASRLSVGKSSVYRICNAHGV